MNVRLDSTPGPNPGLEPYELSEYTGVAGQNFYHMLPTLRRHLRMQIPAEDMAAVEQHLNELGELVGGRINELVIASHKEGKYGKLEKFDRHGNRIDEIIYCTEQLEAKKLAYDAGIVNLDFHDDWSRPFHLSHREACAYVSNLNGEAGYNCPLAMTEGTIEILRAVATEEQQRKYLPLIAAPDAPYHFAAGQYLTERVGGSNVGANRTVARKQENGKWLLTGEKWFCSNPAELWLTTAKIEDSEMIGVFMVPRHKENGELNDHHIMRLKDIIGSRGKATAEVEYRGAEAEMLGRPHTGLPLLIKHVINVSRMHAGFSAVAGARRAFFEARAYADAREAFGQKIKEFPSMQRKLAQMQVMLTALELCVFEIWNLRESDSPAFDLVTPLMKYKGTSEATRLCHEAIMVHGGNGILNDYSVLPRLLNDAIINETWEGTHNILANHTVKSFRRSRSRDAFLQMLADGEEAAGEEWLKQAIAGRKRELEKIDLATLSEANRLPLCDEMFAAYALSRFAVVLARGDEAIYLPMARGFLDYVENGDNGLLPADSVFLQEAQAQAIINF